jgi:hypothetical protein
MGSSPRFGWVGRSGWSGALSRRDGCEAGAGKGHLHFLIESLLDSCHKKVRPATRGLKNLGKAIQHWKFLLREGRTQPGNDFELPQCAGPVPNGGSRRLQGFARTGS